MSDIVERLERLRAITDDIWVEETCQEARAELARLRVEIERLRAVLHEIVKIDYYPDATLARAALAPGGKA